MHSNLTLGTEQSRYSGGQLTAPHSNTFAQAASQIFPLGPPLDPEETDPFPHESPPSPPPPPVAGFEPAAQEAIAVIPQSNNPDTNHMERIRPLCAANKVSGER